MKKPIQRTKKYYDYHDCSEYLQDKHKYNERDYAGKFSKRNDVDKDTPYLDFWHWVIDRHEIHNGCFLTFSKEELDEIDEDWVKTIYSYYIEEFADDKGELEMYVWW